MTTWNAGYVSDLNYTYGYYTELNPMQAGLALASRGKKSTKIENACELGFGHGVSTVIHSAASNIKWYGNDFIPSQALFASDLTKEAGCDAELCDDSFEEFLQRTDLPKLDFIGLHGIWSWISATNQRLIVEFVRRNLSLGGILYISYNTLPGWSNFAPVRHLMTEHAKLVGAESGNLSQKIESATAFAKKLVQIESQFLLSNPSLKLKMEEIEKQNVSYLAHEYFNKDWSPIYFSQMAEALEPCKLNYGAPAALLDHIDAANLTTDQSAFIDSISSTILQQGARDVLVNQSFRRDLWVKGVRAMKIGEQLADLRSKRFVMLANHEDVELKIKGVRGEIELRKEIYAPILDSLANAHITTVAELEQSVKKNNVDIAQLFQAIMILAAKGAIRPAQDPEVIEGAHTKTQRLNKILMERSKLEKGISFLASPVTGGGIGVSRFDQLFLLSVTLGADDPKSWAEFAWSCLKTEGQKIVKDRKTLESEEDNRKELLSQATYFSEKTLPALKAALII